MFRVEHAQQFVFLNDEKCGWCNGCSRAHPNRLARHASFAKKVTWTKHGDYRFFPGPIHHGEFHASLLHVHDGICSFSLRVNRFPSPIIFNFSRHPCGIEEDLWVERIDPSILLDCFRFHIQLETPSLHGRSTPALTLPRRLIPGLYNKGQSTALIALRRLSNLEQTVNLRHWNMYGADPRGNPMKTGQEEFQGASLSDVKREMAMPRMAQSVRHAISQQRRPHQPMRSSRNAPPKISFDWSRVVTLNESFATGATIFSQG